MANAKELVLVPGMMGAAMLAIADTAKAALAGKCDPMTALADIAALSDVELQVEAAIVAKAAA